MYVNSVYPATLIPSKIKTNGDISIENEVSPNSYKYIS
jgi:hypothetical protein